MCSRAIWEMSKTSLYVKPGGVALDLPNPIGCAISRLPWDTDSEIAVSALRTQAIFIRALLEQPADADAEAHKEKDHDPIEDMVIALAEVVGS